MSDKINKNKKDKRFDKIIEDPRFKPIPKKVQKVQLNDKRFNAMFKDKNFISSTDIDEYGRKITSGKGNIQMEKFYMVNKKDLEKEKEPKQEEEEVEEEEEEESDTSEEFEEFLEEMKAQEEQQNQLAEEENIPTGEETKRFAVMNIDWENIHAIDLYVLLNSFCKNKSKVLKVEIYPSEYGIKEQEKENQQGPDKEIFQDNNNDNTNTDKPQKEEDGFDQVKLRQYELKKLKYYYAVVTCDSVQTASQLYNECDGQEIERTQSFMDLRFIPDSLTQFPYPPKETCDHIPPDFDYVPNFRPNAALQDTKVKLTWDQTNPKRDELLTRAFKKEQFDDNDYEELLASSDSEDDELIKELEASDEEEEHGLNLLGHKRKLPKIKDGDTIEIKFNKGLEGINKDVNNDENNKDAKSKWEEFKERKKNIRREKKKEEKRHRIEVSDKRKGKTTKSELGLLVDKSTQNKTFKFNPNDERFNTKGNVDFAVDPTSSNYKKIKK